ncbi:hypothetical protein A3H38_00465 [candidate division WOR-1 bacterium RIFCSPLOWO2_02_FULL_46_20]|uniref:Membrane insertase YidC/Oxa/ALB C-terminal domain-containing protein n=2 Tax=Saganbacteria TaxID=1703751 RepID=A0A1F4RFM7_UNCSA|nr:MAG: hypothetical protein A3J44_06465 [candidate division WOR-1 bacterium RIFCSPHIGHO2_02_FULL_45_12]OGC06989.1 MAG: hypothetical protein A3H38_00465 [candidate division WOR-1 bacterium RIFCSPLOWO2_02_FULL_46_20]OGC09492.1 MAG: hypothetical protein A3F86_02620 [candidate division WOR-1 bacterium RIFCSPLOWO2_12_FULL_45_9]
MEFLSDMMLDALKFFAYFGGYGWGIIWLTLAVNLALYPLTLSSTKAMSAMQKMQPKMKDLQNKHKNSPQELQKETMQLYRSEGVNPLGGCLPMLLKIPFFLALFWAFLSPSFLSITSDPGNNTKFLWINGRIPATEFRSDVLVDRLEKGNVIKLDIVGGKGEYVWNDVLKIEDKLFNDVMKSTSPERAGDIKKVKESLGKIGLILEDDDVVKAMTAWGNTNSLSKPERINTPVGRISVLALLVGITTLLMQMTMPGAGGQQAQMMTMFMPLFIVFICWSFPVGVQLYWLVSNVAGALQQYYIMKKPSLNKGKKGA